MMGTVGPVGTVGTVGLIGTVATVLGTGVEGSEGARPFERAGWPAVGAGPRAMALNVGVANQIASAMAGSATDQRR